MGKLTINVTETSIVKPAAETPRRFLWNSTLDNLVVKIHLPSIYWYRRTPGNFFDAAVMKDALSKALVPYYPIAGRLCPGENNRVHVDCNAEGVLFVEAQTDAEIDYFGDFTPTPDLLSLVPKVDYSAAISSYPILLVQVTHFKCGGASLGICMHHYVGDGFSVIEFVNTWSDIARGLDVRSQPFIDRTLLRARDPPRPAFEHTEYSPPPPLKTPAAAKPTDGALAAAVLKITTQQLAALKARCNEAKFSSFEVLAGHIWRCTCLARELPDDQLTKVYVATGGRSRLEPPLPESYFGNVVFTAAPIALAGDLRVKPMSYSASQMRDALAQMDNEYLRSAIDYIELQPDLSALVRGPKTYVSPNLGITTWVGMPLYEADFGWGRPFFMGPAGCGIEGIAFVLPSRFRDHLTVMICLQKDHLDTFKKIFYDI